MTVSITLSLSDTRPKITEHVELTIALWSWDGPAPGRWIAAP